MALCSKCGKDNREGSRFCQSCGTALVAAEVPRTKVSSKRSSQELAPAPVCSSCGTLNAPGMKFCKMCGSPLEAPQGQPTRLSCPSCGGQTPSAYKFCQHCGTPLPRAAAGPAASPIPAAAPAAAVPLLPVLPDLAEPAPSASVLPSLAPASMAASPAPAAGPTSAASPASLTRPAGASPFQAAAVVAAAAAPRDQAPSFASPLQAALQPAADLIGARSAASGDLAKTIIEMNDGAVAPSDDVKSPWPATAEPIVVQVAAPSPAVVSGSIQTPATPPSGMPAGSREPGKSTVGPGAARRPSSEVAARKALARLVSVSRDGTDGQVHPIEEECFDLGRTEGQLVFNEDPYLSERHCRFCIRNGRWQVQDLQSCNGIYLRVGGTLELHHNDRLLLGKQVLVFELLGEHERALAPAVQHGVLIFGSPLRTPWGRLRQITVAGIFRDVYFLYRPRITIGREEGDLLFPDDEFMSRQHLSLTLAGAKVQLQDLQSSNGTFVQIREPQELQPGALIRVGDQLLRFEPV